MEGSSASKATNNNNVNVVDTANSERPVFLMKCPPVVSRSFHSSSSSSFNNYNNNNNNNAAVPVAKVVFSLDPLRANQDDATQFTMELTGTNLGNVPKFFSMDMSKDFAPMSVFSESQGKISVEGKIKNKFDMRPQYDGIESYGKLCRERTDKYSTKTRQIQVIGHEKPMMQMPGILHVQEKKKVVAKGSETKRTRRDRGEMEEITFKLFEQQPNWTLKELINKTDQPEQFMKDILKDLCVYNNKGVHQGSYQLKPEYRKSIDDQN